LVERKDPTEVSERRMGEVKNNKRTPKAADHLVKVLRKACGKGLTSKGGHKKKKLITKGKESSPRKNWGKSKRGE